MKKLAIKYYYRFLYNSSWALGRVLSLFNVKPKKQLFEIRTWFNSDSTIRYQLHGYRHFRDYYSNAEPQTWNFLFNTLDSRGAIIDVGANVGQFSLVVFKILSQRYNLLPRIICFEPIKSNYDLMVKNFNSNGFVGETHNIAIGIQPEQKVLSIHEVYERLKCEGVFRVESLDSLIEVLKLESVQLLKIDTDGFELEIIKGAHKFLETYKPKILIELNLDIAKKLGIELSVIENELNLLGYLKDDIFDNENALFVHKE